MYDCTVPNSITVSNVSGRVIFTIILNNIGLDIRIKEEPINGT